MTRISVLFLLLLPTVLSSNTDLFNTTKCGEDKEFACIVQDSCKDGKIKNEMVEMKNNEVIKDGATCNVRVMIKQYTKSSYFIRFMAKVGKRKSHQIKWIKEDKTFFGCQLKDGKKSVIPSDSTQYKMISPEDMTELEKESEEMNCELFVTGNNGLGIEIYGDKGDMTLENGNEKLTMNIVIRSTISTLFKTAEYKCNPRSINYGGPKFNEGGRYSLIKILVHDGMHDGIGSCPDDYKMAFEDNNGEIKEDESIECKRKSSCNTNSKDCEWEYVTPDQQPVPDNFKVVCRMMTCKMCSEYTRICGATGCKGPDLETPKEEGKCNTLMCKTHYDGESIVKIDGGKRAFGKFECTNNGVHEKPWWFFIERPRIGETKAHNFTTAACYESINCEDYSPLNLECKEKDGCPKIDESSNNVTCPDGFQLELRDSTGTPIKPRAITCDQTTGIYKIEGDAINDSDINKYEVACARNAPAAASSAGLPGWVWIVIAVAVIVLIALLIFCILWHRRSKKKADEAKKALLKKNDSQQSSTESNKPPPGPSRVQMQCSTAKQISSEQPSEGTAKEKTNKELVEKTVIEPTIDPRTALSTTKSRKESKRESSSFEPEIDDAKRSSKEGMSIPEESNVSTKAGASRVSKKEGKEDQLKPRKFELNEKEKQIAKGVWRKNEDYPTMADIESDWDDAKDGKPPSKQRTNTKDIPTADTPSARGAKMTTLNEKTAEMERLLDQEPPLKLQRVTASEELPREEKEKEASEDSRASVRKTTNKMATVMGTLDVTQDQK